MNPWEARATRHCQKHPLFAAIRRILVHDHETSLYSYGLDHAECNVHLLRYLIKNGGNYSVCPE